MFFKKFLFGDTAVYYFDTPVEGHEKTTTVGFAAYPSDVEVDPKKLHGDSIVQVAFTGDDALVDYTNGVTMRNRTSTVLKVDRQTQFMGGNLNTYLVDGNGNEYVHRLFYDKRTGVFTVNVRYNNRSKEARTLEMLQSLSLSGILSPASYDTVGFTLHRMTSAWSRECRMKSEPFSSIGQDMSWARYGVKVEKWGQNGSMPNRGYFPFGALESPEGLFWGFMPEAPFSWQMELYKEKESCALSCGLADFETGHWRKRVPAGGSFTTDCARFTVKRGGLEKVCAAFVREQDSRLIVPESEEDMPVLYNEYCATWGNPSEKKIERQLAAVSQLGVKYFVIDSGWYKPLDKGWCNAIGDWNINPEIFPDMKRVTSMIKAKGMKAGIWFEHEITGRDSEAFYFEGVHLHRDGKVITSKNRRFLDLRQKDVQDFLEAKVVRMLKENGFEYIKIDYNDTFGVGCDSADGSSLGEGGRQVTEESLKFLDRLKEAIPGIVIENCSSGGSRIEPLRMSKVSMCSFSDAHECNEIPLVAANVSRVIPARQSQIWAVIRKGESDTRTIYSLCAAMMGRICLSGDISARQKEKMALIQAGLDFYESVKEIVRRGEIVSIDNTVEYYRSPKGRQIYTKEYGKQRLVIVHFLEGAQREVLDMQGFALKDAYTDLSHSFSEGKLTLEGEDLHAGAFLFEREA